MKSSTATSTLPSPTSSKVGTKTVVLLSGGMDSTTLLHWVRRYRSKEVYPISFLYGQKHTKEVILARKTCDRLGLYLKIVVCDELGDLAPSSLTRSNIDIPEGHYEAESMKLTVVPNRNMTLLALATAYAIGIGAGEVAYAAHSGDHAIYPDCRPEFVTAMREAMRLCHDQEIRLVAPFLYASKADILKKGLILGVDYSLTWSCYKGGEKACGKCGTCVERLEAFKKIGVEDPIEYEEEVK